MMKIRVKAPWMDAKGLHKIGDVAEVETAAFDPLRMEEIRGKATVICEPINLEPEEVQPLEVEEEADKPVKRTRKKKV